MINTLDGNSGSQVQNLEAALVSNAACHLLFGGGLDLSAFEVDRYGAQVGTTSQNRMHWQRFWNYLHMAKVSAFFSGHFFTDRQRTWQTRSVFGTLGPARCILTLSLCSGTAVAKLWMWQRHLEELDGSCT